ncbi:hypothetical protein GCM10023339_68990 [Alloalcanivorax gelatiniphagus]
MDYIESRDISFRTEYQGYGAPITPTDDLQNTSDDSEGGSKNSDDGSENSGYKSSQDKGGCSDFPRESKRKRDDDFYLPRTHNPLWG